MRILRRDLAFSLLTVSLSRLVLSCVYRFRNYCHQRCFRKYKGVFFINNENKRLPVFILWKEFRDSFGFMPLRYVNKVIIDLKLPHTTVLLNY